MIRASCDLYNPLLVLDIPATPLSTTFAIHVDTMFGSQTTVQIRESATSWDLSPNLLPQLCLLAEILPENIVKNVKKTSFLEVYR
jgi:hypothetical protein